MPVWTSILVWKVVDVWVDKPVHYFPYLFSPIVTRPFYENRLNWVADPTPPASRRLDDMTSPAPAPAVPTPPAEAHPRLPGCLRSRRRRRRKAATSANSNSASRQAALATPLTPPANDNSSRWASSVAT